MKRQLFSLSRESLKLVYSKYNNIVHTRLYYNIVSIIKITTVQVDYDVIASVVFHK